MSSYFLSVPLPWLMEPHIEKLGQGERREERDTLVQRAPPTMQLQTPSHDEGYRSEDILRTTKGLP